MLPIVENYANRMEVLAELGFPNLLEYLVSEHWEKVKLSVFAIHGTSCYVCNRLATTVHLCSYSLDTLSGEDLTYLLPLCKFCNDGIALDIRRSRTGLAPVYGKLTGKLWKHKHLSSIQLHPMLRGMIPPEREGPSWWESTGKHLYGNDRKKKRRRN